jgi:hypothetical protein
MKKLLLFLILISVVFSCKRELSPNTEGKNDFLTTIEDTPHVPKCGFVDDLSTADNQRAEYSRRGTSHPDAQLLMKNGKIWRASLRRCQPHFVTSPDKVICFLDYKGGLMTGTIWNWNGDVRYEASALDPVKKAAILSNIKKIFPRFQVEFTTDSAVYAAARFNRRVRAIVTSYTGDAVSTWTPAGGWSFPDQMSWGYQEIPIIVFADLLLHNVKFVSEAIAHEFGHAAGGLFHQSFYDSICSKTEYNSGIQSKGVTYAPTMGNSYNAALTGFWYGKSSLDCSSIQDDFSFITQRIPLALTDHSSSVPIRLALGNPKENTLIDQDDKVVYEVKNLPYAADVSVISGGTVKVTLEIRNRHGVLLRILEGQGVIDIPKTRLTGLGYQILYFTVQNSSLDVTDPLNRPQQSGSFRILVEKS